MVSAEHKLRVCERHYTREGQPFSIEGREWVRDQLFIPASSWKLWSSTPDKLCAKCKPRIGEFVEWTPAIVRTLAKHRSKACTGLDLYPVMVVILNLPRGGGKTTNAAAFIVSSIVTETGFTATFFATAGKQSRTILREYFIEPVVADPKLRACTSLIGDRVTCPSKRSFVEAVETSDKSVTGRRRRLLYIEEARDVERRTFAKVLPSIRAQLRFECERGHAKAPYDDREIPKCPVCRALMRPVVPRVIICSTSGILDGGERDWFDELVEGLTQNPKPWVHLYRDDDVVNPDASRVETDMIREVFADVPSLAELVDVELSNRSRRKGEDFVSPERFRLCVDKRIDWVEGSLAPCVGFLDASLCVELTSLVIIGDDEELEEAPWRKVRLFRADVWDPKKSKIGIIDRGAIEEHLAHYMPLFPQLNVRVDCRGALKWPPELVENVRKNHPTWGKRVFKYFGSTGKKQTRDRQDGWVLFEERILARTYRQPPHELIEREIRGVHKVKLNDGSTVVRDRSRKIQHADVIEGISECMREIWTEQTRPRITMSRVLDRKGPIDAELDRMFAPITRGLGGMY